MQQERGRSPVQMGMSRFDNATPDPVVRRNLHVCERCRMPFVVPVSILDVYDDRYIVELACTNCEASSLCTQDEASLEALDHELDRTLLAMQEALDTLVLAD